MQGEETTVPFDGGADNSEQPLVGRRNPYRWLTPVCLILIPLLIFTLYFKVMSVGLTNPDAMDFAQVARNLGAGRGFTTYILRPLALEGKINPARLPDMTHGPLYPFLLAISFAALGAKDTVAVGMSGIFYLLTVPLVYLFGKRLFNTVVAIGAASLFALNPLVLDYAVSGLHITLYIFLITGLFYVLYLLSAHAKQQAGALKNQISKPLIAIAGVLTGLLYLTDPAFFWIIPVIIGAVVIIHPVQKPSAALWISVPILVLISPWMLRNALTAGNPVFGLKGAEVWMNTAIYPGSTGYRLFSSELVPDSNLFTSILRKGLIGMNQILRMLPAISISWVLAFFLPSLLFKFKDKSSESVRRISLACFLALVIEMFFFSVQLPLFVGLMSVFMMFALAYIQHLIQQARLNKFGTFSIVSLLVLTVVYPLFHDMVLKDHPQPLRLSPAARELGKRMSPGEVCVSDQPWVYAWYADRPSAWIPARDEKMAELRNKIPQANWLFLTEQSKTFSPSWEYVYSNFYRWSLAYMIADVQKTKKPADIIIDGNGQPLVEALHGFTSVPPVPNLPPGVVMVHVNPAAQNPITQAFGRQ